MDSECKTRRTQVSRLEHPTSKLNGRGSYPKYGYVYNCPLLSDTVTSSATSQSTAWQEVGNHFEFPHPFIFPSITYSTHCFCAKRRYYSESNIALNSGYNNQSWVTLVDFISHATCNSHRFCAQRRYYSESNIVLNSGY